MKTALCISVETSRASTSFLLPGVEEGLLPPSATAEERGEEAFRRMSSPAHSLVEEKERRGGKHA